MSNQQPRSAIVTGATSGIGKAVARRLCLNGFRVVANGRKGLDVSGFCLGSDDERLISIDGDVRDPDLAARLFNAAASQWGAPPDTFVLSAGFGLPGTVLKSDAAKWNELFEVNCLAVMRQMRYFMSQSIETRASQQKPVDLVVIGSTVGRQISAANPVYGAAKFALHSAVEALRQEVCQHNIRVSLIEPGFVKSGFQATAGYDEGWFRSVENDFGPLLQPEDVAGVVDFIVSQPPHVHVDNVRLRPTKQRP